MSAKPVFIISFLVVMLFPASKMAAQAWEFVKEKNGIKLFTRKEPNSSLLSFRGETEMQTTMEKISHYIGNIENTEWWDDNVIGPEVLAFEKEKYIRYYVRYDLTWPISDRDLCVEAYITTDPVSGERKVDARPLPDIIPEKDGVIRIRNYWQTWSVLPVGDGKLKVTLEGFVDPAGSVPAWIYNMVITDTPLKLIREIQQRVTQ